MFGEAGIEFDTSNDLLYTNNVFTLNGSFTFAFVATRPAASSYMLDHVEHGVKRWGTFGAASSMFERPSSQVSTRSFDTALSADAAGTYSYMQTASSTHATHKVYVNGAERATSSVSSQNPSAATTNPAAICVGALTNSGAGLTPCGSVFGEVLVFDRALSDSERELLEAYFRDRYGHY
jgi:hypothetical protein